MRDLYPAILPNQIHYLKVSDLHTLYVEESGNPKGKPVILLHGGPGGGTKEVFRQYFDPKKWRLIMFDQRGCGKSTPHSELRENTTWDLVSDVEKVRNHFNIKTWTVFGGSWGSTLALAYSQKHPEACEGLILRGIFTLRRKELLWFYQEGTSNIFPDLWEEYLKPIPLEERHDMMSAYYKRLTSEDKNIRMQAAKAWSTWEGATSKLLLDPASVETFGEDKFADAFARIECHYFVNKGFLESDDQLLRGVEKIKHLPCTIVQGRYDVVCPMTSAWELHKSWPKSKLVVVADSGHSMAEIGIRSALIDVTDSF